MEQEICKGVVIVKAGTHTDEDAEHVGKLSYFLCIGDGLVKGMREIVGAENGQVGVIGFQILVGVTVYDCQIIVIVFLAYKASRGGLMMASMMGVLMGRRLSDGE